MNVVEIKIRQKKNIARRRCLRANGAKQITIYIKIVHTIILMYLVNNTPVKPIHHNLL